MNENQAQHTQAKAMIAELFTAIDDMDANRFESFLSEHIQFQFANADPTKGRLAVGEMVQRFFASIQGLSHEITNIFCDGAYLVTQGRVTYTRHDSTQLTVPFVNVFKIIDNLIEDYSIYVDISGLYT
jgi:predicted ester cyclase